MQDRCLQKKWLLEGVSSEAAAVMEQEHTQWHSASMHTACMEVALMAVEAGPQPV